MIIHPFRMLLSFAVFLVFATLIFLNSTMQIYNCLSGFSYMNECQHCQDKNMSYAMCSGFCYDDDEIKCGVDRGDCCYNNLELTQSALGTTCSYRWGVVGYYITYNSLLEWQQQMIEEYC